MIWFMVDSTALSPVLGWFFPASEIISYNKSAFVGFL